ncbi:MAG: rRNA maturation RNase YbeY [Balneolaceae bacterium]|nr:rRNA maturation RNase YbeY [Balneolaceae bacterium]
MKEESYPIQETEVRFNNETDHPVPLDERKVRKCVSEVARQDACSFSLVEVVYVDEETIRRINREHLDREYVTDIITFRYDDESRRIGIEGTLFCCAPRISEQAREYEPEEETEFTRVLIHGLLHLAGYDDRSEEEKSEMRGREEFYLDLLA